MLNQLEVESVYTVEIGRMFISKDTAENLGMTLFELTREMHTCREVIAWIYEQLPQAHIYFDPDIRATSIAIKARFGDQAEATAFKLRWAP